MVGFVANSLSLGLAVGTTVLVARRLGAGDARGAFRAEGASLLAALALALVSALTVYTTGFAAAEVAPPAGGAAGEPDAGLPDALAGLSGEERQALTRLVTPIYHEGWSFADQFEVGLRVLVDGWGNTTASRV